MVPRTDERNYVYIDKITARCKTLPGMRGGRQVIKAGRCQTFHLVHEIMHVLGIVLDIVS